MKQQQQDMDMGFSVHRNSEKPSEDPATAKPSDHSLCPLWVLGARDSTFTFIYLATKLEIDLDKQASKLVEAQELRKNVLAIVAGQRNRHNDPRPQQIINSSDPNISESVLDKVEPVECKVHSPQSTRRISSSQPRLIPKRDDILDCLGSILNYSPDTEEKTRIFDRSTQKNTSDRRPLGDLTYDHNGKLTAPTPVNSRDTSNIIDHTGRETKENLELDIAENASSYYSVWVDRRYLVYAGNLSMSLWRPLKTTQPNFDSTSVCSVDERFSRPRRTEGLRAAFKNHTFVRVSIPRAAKLRCGLPLGQPLPNAFALRSFGLSFNLMRYGIMHSILRWGELFAAIAHTSRFPPVLLAYARQDASIKINLHNAH
ncbi:MAG: hypothetical protein Q9214_000861 [Letrouitia sp. 1 TL-2023]